MRKHSRKRALSIDEIERCNPASMTRRANKNRGSGGSCLPRPIYNKLRREVGSQCKADEEHCMLDKASSMSVQKRNQLRTEYLRPRRPAVWDKDPDDWLDNFIIQDAMEQYPKACPWFKFLGVYPIDFSVRNPYEKDKEVCLHPEMCNIDIHKEYEKGVRAFGAVFNLDPHYKGGSHWVALYCDIHDLHAPPGSKRRPWCAYFDSYGYDTPPYIARFMRFLYSQDNRLKLMYNARRFQYSTSECGMYSMYFIVCMMNGIQFGKFCKHAIPDSVMLQLRKRFFTK